MDRKFLILLINAWDSEINCLKSRIVELEKFKAEAIQLGSIPPAADPKSPAGALSGLMSRLRSRNGLRKG
jgi:hypothetical protein